MATTITRRDYTTRDFDSFKQKLREYVEARFPNASNDFYEDNYLVVLNELMAYMGDQLSFHIDMQANEVMWDTVGQRTNIVNLAKLLGYEPRGVSSSQVAISCTVPSYTGTLSIPKGTQVFTLGEAIFEVKQNYAFNGDLAFDLDIIEGPTRIDTHTSDGTTSQAFVALYPDVSHSEAPIVTVDGTPWTEVEFLWDSGVGQYYQVQYLEDGRFRVAFGDGVYGDIPPASSSIEITYRTTIGAPGNLSSGTITGTFEAQANAAVTVTFVNNDGSSGGASAESVDEIRNNAPVAFQSLGVVTTARDLKGFVDAVAGIAKSGVSVDSATKVVSVYVVADGYSAPSQALLDSIQADLEEVLVIGAILRMYPAEFPEINVSGRIYLKPNYSVEEVRDSVTRVLAEYFTPEDPAQSSKDVGTTVYYSDIVRLLDEADGVEYVELDTLLRRPTPETIVWNGDSTFDAVSTGAVSKEETWTLRFTSPTDFTLTGSSSGLQVATGVVDTPYSTDLDELHLTVTAGSTPNQSGDYAEVRTSRYLGNVLMDQSEYSLQGTVSLGYNYAL